MPIVVQVCLFLVFFMNYLRMVFVSSQSVVVPTSLTGRLVFSISRLWRTTRNRKWKDSKLSNEGCHRGMYKCIVYLIFTFAAYFTPDTNWLSVAWTLCDHSCFKCSCRDKTWLEIIILIVVSFSGFRGLVQSDSFDGFYIFPFLT